MTFIKIENNIVVQKQLTAAEGFVEAPSGVVCGMVHNNGSFDLPDVSTDQLSEWLRQMELSDQIMTRVEEDIITVIGVENLPMSVQEKYNSKLMLRANKPA